LTTNLAPKVDPTNRSASTTSGALKRVLFLLGLNPAGKFGSLEEQTLTLARAFREEGRLFLPVFVDLDLESKAQYTDEGLPVETLDLMRFRFANLRQLLDLVRRHRIEVVHWNFYNPLANGYLWALSVLTPTVEHYYTDHISRYAERRASNRGSGLKLLCKRLLAFRHRKILGISDFVLDQGRQMRWPNLQRIAYFVNSDRFRPDLAARRQVREGMGVRDEFVILAVAQLIRDKGIDVALRALVELPPEVLFWIIGLGPERDTLEALVGTLGLGPRVRFLGPRRRVEPFMQAADCLVCPSVWQEAVGLVILEAASCGLPVIASRVGGIPEFIEDGRTGILFAPGDHEEVAEGLSRLMSDEELRNGIGREARSAAVARFSIESQLEAHLALYRAKPASE
jgi:glycosyltransferase involved in cell wall biosynthesis